MPKISSAQQHRHETVQPLSTSAQDYVKAIWKLHEWHHDFAHPERPCAITAGMLAKETGMLPSTISGAMARLSQAGLVAHAPYGGIELTDLGKHHAMDMLRRHRIIETYLVRELGYSWDEVHEEAEALEHTASPRFINRMEEKLGFPDRDPHGDPIPNREGIMPQFDTLNLALVPLGESVVISRVNDDDAKLLHLFSLHNVSIDSVISVTSATSRSLELTTQDGESFEITRRMADNIRVSRIVSRTA